MHDMRDTFYEEALQDVGLRQLVPTQFGTYDLFTVEEPVTTADKWEGKVLRSSGWIHDRVADAFGASGEGISPTEMYEALQRGTVNGMIWPVQSVPPYSLQEQANHWVGGDQVNLGGNAGNLYIGDDVFSDLSDETQDVFLEEIEKSVVDGSEFTKQTREEATQTALDAGVERHDIEDPEAWQENVDGIRSQWVDMDDSHEEVLDEFQSTLENYA
jgi:TRAP-type C4-dicarboxylate transport system substrate-binding protein